MTFRPRTGTPVTDAFRRWLATATPEQLQAFADTWNSFAAALREAPLCPLDPGLVLDAPEHPDQPR